jgi:hypothetical protein
MLRYLLVDHAVPAMWRSLVAFSHLQFSQIRGRQPYSIVRKIPYLIMDIARPGGE